MAPQEAITAVKDQQQVLTDERSPLQCTPQELFRYIDEQHSNVVSEMEDCELRRKELVKEMTVHMQSFEFSSMGNAEDPVFQRHTELTMQLSGLHKEYSKLEKKLAAVELLADKRKDVEASLERRLKIVEHGEQDKFGIEELRQIIESQASATLEVEILNQERGLLEVQLKETKKQAEELQMQCSEKDAWIKALKMQNESYQQELASFQRGSTVPSQSSSQLSCLRSNLEVQNALIRKRLSSRNLQSPGSSLSIPEISNDDTKSSPPPMTSSPPSTPKVHNSEKALNLSSDESTSNKQPDPLPALSEEDVKRQQKEKKLRQRQQHLEDEARKEEERRHRDQRLRNEAASLKKQQHLAEASSLKKEQHLEDEAKKEEERRLREQRLQIEAAQEEERKRAQQKEQQSRQGVQENAAKEEERRLRQMQEQQQAALQEKEALATPTAERERLSRQMLSPGGSVNSRVSFEYAQKNQARREAALARLSAGASLSSALPLSSPTPSVASSRASREMSKAGFIPPPRLSAAAARPGAMRVTADGNMLDDDSDDEDSVENSNNDHGGGGMAHRESAYSVTATLVEELNPDDISTAHERRLEERERALRAREAAIVQQTKRMHSITATASASVAAVPVAAVATPVATISQTGSIRQLDLTRQYSSISDMSHSFSHFEEQSIRTMGTIGEDSATPDLGPGPLRFHAATERKMRKQFDDISDKDYGCFQTLQSRWEKKRKEKGGAAYSETLILRFLRNTCQKDGSFNLNKAWKAMKKTKERNLFLSASKLQKQLLTATLFPVPGLVSNAGFEMFYMKPSRFHRKDSVKDVIDNLIYVMNCMLEKELNAKNGIGFMACMNDWTMGNFDTTYCYQFMMALQGAVVPVAVELFLIVNPPSWFGKVWKVMKPMLAPSFRKKVKVIKEVMLDQYLMEGYQYFLPDDLDSGTVNTFQLAQDFVTYRRHMEMGNVQLNAKSSNYDDESSVQFSVVSGKSDENSGAFNSFRKTASLDASSHRSLAESSDMYDASTHASSSHVENEDDDASIHCSIHDDDENSGMMEV